MVIWAPGRAITTRSAEQELRHTVLSLAQSFLRSFVLIQKNPKIKAVDDELKSHVIQRKISKLALDGLKH